MASCPALMAAVWARDKMMSPSWQSFFSISPLHSCCWTETPRLLLLWLRIVWMQRSPPVVVISVPACLAGLPGLRWRGQWWWLSADRPHKPGSPSSPVSPGPALQSPHLCQFKPSYTNRVEVVTVGLFQISKYCIIMSCIQCNVQCTCMIVWYRYYLPAFMKT